MFGYIMFVVGYICLVVFVLMGVAFFTLLERKILGYIQIRKGPNKVSVVGILQPFADAIKLFTKGNSAPMSANSFLFYVSPGIMIVIMLCLWGVYNFQYIGLDFSLGIVYFLCCSSVGVYSLFFSGWASNSKYALLGALRGVAQSISYEVALALILLGVLMLVLSYELDVLYSSQALVWFVFIGPVVVYMWFTSMLAETNRTPFDFAEGESELVSGFNVEYSGGLFAVLFMSEYGSIMFMSYFTCLVYFGGLSVASGFIGVVFIVLFIWVRGTMPRFRYDSLMYLVWSSYLPVVLNYLVFYNGIMVLFVWFGL